MKILRSIQENQINPENNFLIKYYELLSLFIKKTIKQS